MGWYDNYKEEKILIQQSEGHNKFWAAWWDETTNKVHIRWGRLGSRGQSQIKDFPGSWKAGSFISGKYSEKLRKGYTNQLGGKEITQSVLDRLHAEAAIIGTQNKCHGFQWVEITQGTKFTDFVEISEERLYDPDCNPGILIRFETRKAVGGRDEFKFLFSLEGTYDVLGYSKQVAKNQLINNNHPLYKMVKKVEDAIGRSLGT
jgi:predicted DNA-binding WGR domain protein